jgi:hypothetical protein
MAHHTKNANTGAIGVSLCGMVNAIESPFDAGPNPITKIQWDAGVEVITQLAIYYKIPVTPFEILTHAEVEPNLKIPQDGKWDITRLPFDDKTQGHKAVGDRLRREILARQSAKLKELSIRLGRSAKLKQMSIIGWSQPLEADTLPFVEEGAPQIGGASIPSPAGTSPE